MTSIKNKRLIITRPLGVNDSSISFFNTQGFEVVSLPLIEIIPKPPSLLKERLSNIDTFHHLIITSPMSALFFAKALKQLSIEPPKVQYWSIGKSTAWALKELNVDVIYPSQGNTSEDFIQFIDDKVLYKEKALILGGDNPRELLGKALEKKGLVIEYLSLYKRENILYKVDHLFDTLYSNKKDGSVMDTHSSEKHIKTFGLTTSGQIVESLYQNIQQNIELFDYVTNNIILLTPSQRVSAIAFNLGFVNVYNASSANDDKLLNILGSF